MKKKPGKKIAPKKAPKIRASSAGDLPHVFQAINAVQGLIAAEGIAKGRENKVQNYAFRGIDDIYNTLAKHLSSVGLVIVPRVIGRQATQQATAKGGVLFYVVLEVEYDLVSTKDNSKHTARIFGEAMDSGDKATNKAMSAAYKYLCLQLFCIPTDTKGNDADERTHRVQAKVEDLLERDRLAAVTGNEVPWRDFVIHFGKNKGATLGSVEKLSKDALLWYVNTWPGHLPYKRPTQADNALRRALDRAKAEFSKPADPTSTDVDQTKLAFGGAGEGVQPDPVSE